VLLLQLVWAETTSIGGGLVTTCSNTVDFTDFEIVNILVCDYAPPGNFIDYDGGYSLYVENVKPAGVHLRAPCPMESASPWEVARMAAAQPVAASGLVGSRCRHVAGVHPYPAVTAVVHAGNATHGRPEPIVWHTLGCL
jgi:hypothetical protein